MRSQTSIASSPFMPSSAAQPREPLGGELPRRDVDVVRRPHRRQHLPLAVADLPAHRRQDLGVDDAVGGDPEERVPLDDLQVEEPPGDRQEADQHDAARSSARAAGSPGALRPVRLSPCGSLFDRFIDDRTRIGRSRAAARAPGRRASGRCRPCRRCGGTDPARRPRRCRSAAPRAGAWRRPP